MFPVPNAKVVSGAPGKSAKATNSANLKNKGA